MKHESLSDKTVNHDYESELNLVSMVISPKVTSNVDVCNFATPLNENISTLEGQHSDSTAPRFNVESLCDTNFGDEPHTVRKSDRVRNLPSKFNDYILPSNKKYGIEKHVNYSKLSGEIERYKARLVAKEFSQRDGIDFEETFSPVVKMVTVRCVISLVVHNNWPLFQLDVNNAFLYGDLHEDVYMDLPPGYYDPFETKVCKLVKSLYGLKQAPRQWNENNALHGIGGVSPIKTSSLAKMDKLKFLQLKFVRLNGPITIFQDVGNPLFLLNNDHSNVPLIGFKLTGTENYKMWSTAIKMALTGKNKFGFVNGTCVKPITSHVLAQQWERCNAIVLGWILSSLSPDLYLGQVYSQIASEVWDELQETYDKMDGEFDTLTLLLACTCAAHEGVLKHNQLIRLVQFLMGLNDAYLNIKSNILARDPLSDLKEAFNVVSREESYRGLHPGSRHVSRNKVQPSAFMAKSNNFRGNEARRGNNNSGNRGGNSFGNSSGKVFNNNTEAPKGASTSSGSTSFDTQFTKDQMMKILSLINDKPSGNANANMASMRPTFFNGNGNLKMEMEMEIPSSGDVNAQRCDPSQDDVRLCLGDDLKKAQDHSQRQAISPRVVAGEIERYKARLVAKEFSQRDGIDFEETFSPVVKMVTVRCVISLAVHNNWPLFQLDVNNAFLYGDLHEDVYMDLPPGYYDPFKTKVCKLVKSLYGLKQAPRQWNEKLTSVLNENDDIVVTGNNVEEISKFKNFLASKFKIKDLGSLKYFLGIEVLRNKQGLCLSQRKYCLELLSEYGLLACKPVATPMQMQQTVSLSHEETDKDKSIMHSPLKSHFSAGLRVLRYLKQSPGLGVQVWEGMLPVPLYCDSIFAIQIAVNPIFHEKTKHFEIDVHLVREKVASGAISTGLDVLMWDS
ncbi:ribonuclease H-like domain-containing protein [Tanacetum coccineum]